MPQPLLRWVTLAAVLLTVGMVAAGGEILPRSLVSSGGGTLAQSGYTLHNAIGQPAVGSSENGLVLCSGYLCTDPVIGCNVYLPAVTSLGAGSP